MALLGILAALGAAVVFLIIGALVLFGGVRTTREQIVPGFLPDHPSPLERLLTLLGTWLPIGMIALLCLLTGIRLLQLILL